MKTQEDILVNEPILIQGDCLDIMKEIPDGSVDMILCDLPYGTTNASWDFIIPFEPLWEQYWRVLKENGAVVLFGSEPFSSHLRMSQMKYFKYDWIWLKDNPTGFLNAKKRPMVCHEILSIFYKKPPYYNPQFWESRPMSTVWTSGVKEGVESTSIYGKIKEIKRTEVNSTQRYPLSYLKMNTVNGQAKDKTPHPTQKPTQLLEYLIKTYTKEGELVLDNCMGSGSTGVACKNTKRNFIGIEKDEKYFEIAKNRINT